MVFYRFFMAGLSNILPLIAVFNSKVKHFLKSRREEKDLFAKYTRPNGNLYWFHCASLGEFEQAKPVINAVLEQKHISVVVSFFSPSGYDFIKSNQHDNMYVTYLPLERVSEIRVFVKKIRPDKVYWVKYELWLLALNEVYKERIPMFLFSANFSSSHFITKFWASPWRNTVARFTQIFVQNKESKAVLAQLGIDCIIAGDTRFDNVKNIAKANYENEALLKWKNGQFTLVAGSSWQKEEEMVVEWLIKNKDKKAIIAPHDIGSQHINGLEKLLGLNKVSYSCFSTNKYEKSSQVLILDEMGKLSRVYSFADVAFVGGGYKNGLHNILEPLSWGKKVITGPNIRNNWEALQAEKVGILWVCADQQAFDDAIESVQKNPGDATFVRDFVSNYSNAVSIILKNS